MLVHVLRPITTALIVLRTCGEELLEEPFEHGFAEVEAEGRLVMRAKKARSTLRGGHGRVPRKPRPREGVVATIRVRRGSGVMAIGGVEMEEDICLESLPRLAS